MHHRHTVPQATLRLREAAERQFGLVAALCLLALLLASCTGGGNGVTTVASTKASVRIVNLIPNANGPLDVTVDGNLIAARLSFESIQPYQQINAITQNNPTSTVQAAVAGSATSLLTTTILPLGETNYSYMMFGPVAQPLAQFVNDTTIDPGAGSFNFRVFNGAAGIGAVDVYVTPPGADLNSASPTVARVGYGSISIFVTLSVGDLELRVTPAGSKNVIFDSPPHGYAERGQVEAVVYSRESGTLVNVALLNLDTSGTGSILNNLLAQFKVVNASQVASPLNVLVNGVLLLSNIPYTGASAYQKTTATMPTLTIEATATPGATLLAISPTLTPGTDSSILIEGSAGALRAAILTDNNLPPAPGNARVRFVNASIDVPSFDVFINFSRQVSSLPQNSGAYALELTADPATGTTYQFGFNVAGTAQTLLTLPSVPLFGGHSYTIYVTGPAASLAGSLTQDN